MGLKMRPKKGNRRKIIEAAIDLFNEDGVGNVGTNRIAAHLQISPGNLYYHFRDKEDIIRAIFPEISAATEAALMINEPNLPGEAQLVAIAKNWMAAVWKYRFFYGNLVELLRNDPELRKLYGRRREATLHFIKSALLATRIREKQGKSPLDDESAMRLAINIWIIALNWIRYLQIDKSDAEISEAEITDGAHQIFALLEPYLDEQAAVILRESFK